MVPNRRVWVLCVRNKAAHSYGLLQDHEVSHNPGCFDVFGSHCNELGNSKISLKYTIKNLVEFWIFFAVYNYLHKACKEKGNENFNVPFSICKYSDENSQKERWKIFHNRPIDNMKYYHMLN